MEFTRKGSSRSDCDSRKPPPGGFSFEGEAPTMKRNFDLARLILKELSESSLPLDAQAFVSDRFTLEEVVYHFCLNTSQFVTLPNNEYVIIDRMQDFLVMGV